MIDILFQQWEQIQNSSWLIIFSVIGFAVGIFMYRRSAGHALLHPLLIGTPLIATIMYWLKIDFDTYYQANGILNWLLGPATVALAVPLSKHLKPLSRLLPTIMIAVTCGGLFAAICAVMLGLWLTPEPLIISSLAAKSVTTPIAMILTDQLGGLYTLITVIVLFTGIVGIVVAQRIFDITKLQDERWQGLILGVTSHAIGTVKAFEKSPRCGAFSTLGMGLNGIWTSFFLIPLMHVFVL